MDESQSAITTEPDDSVVITAPTQYIITFDELATTQGAIAQKEATDKQSLLDIFEPNPTILKSRLITWASVGFPSNWIVFTRKTDPPGICSDGQVRAYYEYVLYLLGQPIESFLERINSQVLGVAFDFFLCDMNTIGLNVSKI